MSCTISPTLLHRFLHLSLDHVIPKGIDPLRSCSVYANSAHRRSCSVPTFPGVSVLRVILNASKGPKPDLVPSRRDHPRQPTRWLAARRRRHRFHAVLDSLLNAAAIALYEPRGPDAPPSPCTQLYICFPQSSRASFEPAFIHLPRPCWSLMPFSGCRGCSALHSCRRDGYFSRGAGLVSSLAPASPRRMLPRTTNTLRLQGAARRSP
ncbi:hypothetical protein C8R47DRAFT_11488 [Mycena vitilis]|nr:hypothetical protein C8R47DRAFT_11488 [Mycena vitilis]